jgi:hypothetical protein
MINLAGVKNCDETIREELTRAGIDIVDIPADERRGEVPASIMGELGKYKFKRAWYYWIVNGHIPIEIADKLYEHPEGKISIRVDGHCGCPNPREYRHVWIDEQNNILHLREELHKWDTFHMNEQELLEKYKVRFVDNRETYGMGVISGYHIDTQAGLLLFVLAVTGKLNW